MNALSGYLLPDEHMLQISSRRIKFISSTSGIQLSDTEL